MMRIKTWEIYEVTYEIDDSRLEKVESVLKLIKENDLFPCEKKFVGLDSGRYVMVEREEQVMVMHKWSYDYDRITGNFVWVKHE